MDENTMGKGFYNNNKVNPIRKLLLFTPLMASTGFTFRDKSLTRFRYSFLYSGVKTITATFLFLMLLLVLDSYASSRESELFDQGYEYYLSYQPQKAVETFNIFLKEFPDSSAKDAAMFWLGKSLIQLKAFETAKKVFSEIKQKFPESPFISHIDRELEIMSRAEAEVNVSKTETEENLSRAIEERERLKSLLEEEKKKAEEMKTRITRLEGKETELNILLSKFEEQQRDWKKFDEYLKQLENEKTQLDLQVQRLNKERIQLEDEIREVKDKVRRYETITIVIKDKKHAPSEILESMIKSSVVMTKLGIKDVLWRNGNIYEDFVNEQILYDEAKRLNITEDAKRYKELIEKYNLKNEEADYLYRYLVISNLIDRKLKDMPEEKVVESLLVRFTEDDEYEKAVLATGLQRDAKSGESFENIYRSYPDVVRFTVRGSQEIHGWIKERVQPLQNGEISDVIWTEDGYIILKPVLKRLSYRPFDPPEADVWPAAEGKIRVSIKEWIDELKKGIEDIKIERAE